MPTTPNFASIVSWSIADPLTEADYNATLDALRANYGDQWGRGTFGGDSVYWSMKARHVLYWRGNAPSGQYLNGAIVNWGNCGQPAQISQPTIDAALNDARLAGTGIGVATTGVLAATGTTSLGAAAAGGGALGSLAGVLAIAGPVAAVAIPLLGIITGIFNHHAAAVAREQNDLCAASSTANQLLDAIDAAVTTGQLDPTAAGPKLEELAAAFQAYSDPVFKWCNEACCLRFELRGEILIREKYVYPSLAAGVPGAISSLVPKTTSGKILMVAAAAGLGFGYKAGLLH